MTNKLLNDKKLLNDTINEFIYKNEVLSFESTNILNIFRKNFAQIFV